jgi:hypothetical protein
MEKELYKSIIGQGVTMITEERFETIIQHKDHVLSLDGDIVECGVWKGGMSIFLSKVFNSKNMWVCDSFEGCQDPRTGKYSFPGEGHTKGLYAINLETVKNNFKLFDALDEPRVSFLQGYVKDTLQPSTCPIKKISLLRIDVDSYSATLEVLDYLYPKVTPGGLIIFDDSCLHESKSAIMHFAEREPNIELKHTITNQTITLPTQEKLPCGCYFIKP